MTGLPKYPIQGLPQQLADVYLRMQVAEDCQGTLQMDVGQFVEHVVFEQTNAAVRVPVETNAREQTR